MTNEFFGDRVLVIGWYCLWLDNIVLLKGEEDIFDGIWIGNKSLLMMIWLIMERQCLC